MLNRSIRYYAEKYHAKLIALEHRYYGKSIPTKTLSTKDLQYLTTYNVLEDIAQFQAYIEETNKWSGSWVVFGASYSGSLAAYYRATHPERVAGALASSAPVKTEVNFGAYDAFVSKVAGPVCTKKIQAATQQIESSMQDNDKMQSIKEMFGAEAVKDNVDFLFLIGSVAGAAVQYGMQDILCNSLDSNNSSLEGYAAFIKFALSYANIDPVSLTPQGMKSENPKDYEEKTFGRSWYFQSCTEYGYWLSASLDTNYSFKSSLINEEYFKKLCHDLFAIDMKVDTDRMNQQYYQPLLRESVSNIFFTNGSNDPWSLLSLTEKNQNTTNKNLDYFMIDGASHCEDVKLSPSTAESPSLAEAHHRLDLLIAKWLK